MPTRARRDQNNITLNGLNFSGTDLPRDATTQTRVSTSTFDPSRGGFSGAQISLRTNSGSNYVTRSMHLMFRQGDREPWTHMQEYSQERTTLPAADLDDPTLSYR